ncbi:MAG: hypothetical protein ACFFA6_13145 [Promethearchaeota archaeon]
MSYKKEKEKYNFLVNNGEKILYGTYNISCFACGEKIDKNITVCPYCKTKIKLG